jgi:hypothetical protein
VGSLLAQSVQTPFSDGFPTAPFLDGPGCRIVKPFICTDIGMAQSSTWHSHPCSAWNIGMLMTAHVGGSSKSVIDIYWLGQGWAGVRQIAC